MDEKKRSFGLRPQDDSVWEESANSLQLWTRVPPIRTISEIDLEFPIFTQELFLCQKISPKAKQLFKLGMNYYQIGKALGIDEKTVKKAIQMHTRANCFY